LIGLVNKDLANWQFCHEGLTSPRISRIFVISDMNLISYIRFSSDSYGFFVSEILIPVNQIGLFSGA
jgi:hypothetical protein